MKTRMAATIAVLVLAVAPISSAMAYDRPAWAGSTSDDVETTGALGAPAGSLFGYDNNPATCPMSSAAEGNANQQNFPVKQYGQTAGGNRC
ncbi:hypothetical protein MKK63_24810 [Methylobacterium sp. J-088]|uniref:hypothetical protein n=1 Tax=unclassified Methylobacterium TaxID=2615210 RepID=UPI001FB94E2B|nr:MULTISPECIES: hypothetical protein [unclassified Methylobacterium]MCJ2065903.1 hypothetical protein [Methylobacterium sp. J-088]